MQKPARANTVLITSASRKQRTANGRCGRVVDNPDVTVSWKAPSVSPLALRGLTLPPFLPASQEDRWYRYSVPW